VTRRSLVSLALLLVLAGAADAVDNEGGTVVVQLVFND
jgi:hypothetical protein